MCCAHNNYAIGRNPPFPTPKYALHLGHGWVRLSPERRVCVIKLVLIIHYIRFAHISALGRKHTVRMLDICHGNRFVCPAALRQLFLFKQLCHAHWLCEQAHGPTRSMCGFVWWLESVTRYLICMRHSKGNESIQVNGNCTAKKKKRSPNGSSIRNFLKSESLIFALTYCAYIRNLSYK